MAEKNYSRREFIRRNSMAGAGAILATGLAPAVFGSEIKKSAIPAILGGSAAANIDWPEWPYWNPETDDKLVLDSIRSGVWSRKKLVDEFEKKWAAAIGAKRCLTVVNGTNSLITSLIQLGIGAGDEVIIPPYTFIATPQSVLATGAMPVFVDTDPETFQIDAAKIEAKITSRTRAIMPVHLGGLSADMDKIMEIARKHNLIVIEDACQAHLAEYNHQKLGTIGHAGGFSFQNSKNLPIGEGGAIVSNDEKFVDRCHSYHNLGFPYGTAIGSVNSGSIMYGNKLRLTEYQAAIGLVQLSRLDSQTKTRTENAEYLKAKLKKIPGILPMEAYPGVTRGVYHLFILRYKKDEFKGLSREGFMNALDAEGIPCYSGYTQLNLMPFLKDAFQTKNFVKTYSKKRLNYSKYLEQNQCPQNDILCNEEAVWFNQRLFLTGKKEMDMFYSAVEKTYANAEKLKKAETK
ncbi:MAG: glutamine--scyllo-inositol aminotransferase [Sphingobacteriales bacterium UTBCD1]|jgi:dTDP-4-amino-4,6-dideoxygalactose transaminase|nr:MAG: glutamine--scyllo-inositol aminotransferase [Sphingobacteriales bacterium UTBCD1]